MELSPEMKATQERCDALMNGFETYCAENEGTEQIDAFIEWGVTQLAGLQAIVIDYEDRFKDLENQVKQLLNRGSAYDLMCGRISNQN